MASTVKVFGVEEVRLALARLVEKLPVALKPVLSVSASRAAAQARAGVPSASGAAASSIRAQGAGITFGGSAAPYFPWLEWGGSVGRGKADHRPFIIGGRYVYPALAAAGDASKGAVGEA